MKNNEAKKQTIRVKTSTPEPEIRTVTVKTSTPERRVPVSKRAIVARLKRALAKEEMILKKARSEAATSQMGEWFIVNDRNHLMSDHIDLEECAREKGLIAPFEYLAD